MTITLSATTRGLDGWFTTATLEDGEAHVLLCRYAGGWAEARSTALEWARETWPGAIIQEATP